jgi:SAM-dependent methyltransferase
LGGFTDFDPAGLSDNVFNWMLGPLGIKSVIDVGCGKGVSTSEFKKKGAHVLCVEGSHDATSQSLLLAHEVVEHDFARGPWWPSETYDAAWSVEFLEHVGRPYMQNYLPIFKKAALLFVTSSGWGGWHHVEVHPHSWWRHRFEAQGFVFSEELTLKVRLRLRWPWPDACFCYSDALTRFNPASCRAFLSVSAGAQDGCQHQCEHFAAHPAWHAGVHKPDGRLSAEPPPPVRRQRLLWRLHR